MSEKIKEFCGLFGIYGTPDAVKHTYYSLYALQHRGEEGAGIAATDGTAICDYRGLGQVGDVFTPQSFEALRGTHAAIGHVRYSTTGSNNITNVQPIVVQYSRGEIAVAHNGNLVNAQAMRNRLESRGSIFRTTTDSEIVLHLLAASCQADWLDALANSLNEIKGAFSLLFLTPKEVVAARDPQGFRPLWLGRLKDCYCFASETCAFDLIGAEVVREVEPGEVIRINEQGLTTRRYAPQARHGRCIFELIYFSRADSMIFGEHVHLFRQRLGSKLAQEHAVDADIVVAVPHSATSAAIGYHRESGIPIEQGFIANNYMGRTFIQPIQGKRHEYVNIKLNAVPQAVKGRKVVVVDDSIVRGTTTAGKMRLLRKAGAKEIHLRISCPPHMFPCYYGIDFASREELIANKVPLEKMADFFGVDTIGYLSIEGLRSCAQCEPEGFCMACFDGKYPVQVDEGTGKWSLEMPPKLRIPAATNL
ncbi:MAG TPA: amidophosphoribosyltransferase [Planctomycetota bacterium]|nr:amidophosphoribosyltransferase [Planctomycetota bacterium]